MHTCVLHVYLFQPIALFHVAVSVRFTCNSYNMHMHIDFFFLLSCLLLHPLDPTCRFLAIGYVSAGLKEFLSHF